MQINQIETFDAVLSHSYLTFLSSPLVLKPSYPRFWDSDLLAFAMRYSVDLRLLSCWPYYYVVQDIDGLGLLFADDGKPHLMPPFFLQQIKLFGLVRDCEQ